MAKYVWTNASSYKAGKDPDHNVEAKAELPSSSNVMVGVGARVNDDNVKTLAIWTAPILNSGELGDSEKITAGSDPDHELEAIAMAPPGYVVVGLGMSALHDDIRTIHIYCRELDSFSGQLSEKVYTVTGGSHPEGSLEAVVDETIKNATKYQELVTSVGVRCHSDDIKTLHVETGVLVRS